MFRYNKLKIRNFLSIGDTELDISQPGIYLVEGENHFDLGADNNGSGKSALFEAIGYVSTGTTFRNIKVNRAENFRRKGGLLVSLDCSPTKDIQFTLVRTRNDNEHKTGFKILDVNGEDVSARIEKHNDKRVKSLLNMNMEILKNTLFITRETIDLYTSMKPKQRYEALEAIIADFMVPFDEMNKKASMKYSELKSRIEQFEKEIFGIEKLIENDSNKLNSLKEQIKDVDINEIIESLQKDKEVAQKNINELTSKLDTLLDKKQGFLKEEEIIKIDLEKIRDIISDRREEIITLNGTIDQHKHTISLHDKELQKYVTIQNSDDPICPYCKQKVDQNHLNNEIDSLRVKISDCDKEINTIQIKVEEITNKIENAKEEKEKLITLDNSISTSKKQVNNEIDGIKDAQANTKQNIKDIENEIETWKSINNNIQTLENDVKTNKQNIENYRTRIANLTQKAELHSKWAHRMSYRGDFRPFILEDIANKQARFSQDYISRLWPNLKLEMPIDNGKVLITLNNDPDLYDGMSSGEKRRVNLCLTLGRNRLYRMFGAHSPNILVFDEALDTLDKKGIEAVSELLDYLVEDQKLGIWVTTHNPRLSLNATKYVMVKDSKGISQLQGPVRI